MAHLIFVLGGIYWLWMAIQFGSISMFIVGIIPPVFIVTGIIGIWSFVFGAPSWVYSFFS